MCIYRSVARRLYAPPGLDPPLDVSQQIARSIAARLPGKRVIDIDPLIRRMRLVKDSYELAALRRAAGISGKSLEAAMREIRPGRNDREIAGLMEYEWKKEGSERESFAPVVSSGPHSMRFFALLAENYNSTDRVMQARGAYFYRLLRRRVPNLHLGPLPHFSGIGQVFD